MRILILDEEFPWPLNTGKRIRSYCLTRELARYHEVSYVAYGKLDLPAVQHIHNEGIQPVVVPVLNRQASGPRFYWRLLKNLASPYPYIVTSHYTYRYQREVNRQIAHGHFDLVIAEWTPYSLYVKRLHGPKKIIVAHNIESAIWRRYEQNEQNPLKRWYISVQHRKVENFERHCFGWVDGATAVSDLEAKTIAGFGPSYPVAVIDNGVDTEYFAPRPSEESTPSLVFTGSMDWRPNQDAANYFVSAIWPLLRGKYPTLRAVFVGRNPTSDLKGLQRVEGVTITGTVDDVRPYIANALVYIVPLRIGGGSRLKILEALAMKKAVVSTTVGAEGLRVIDGQHLILADSPAEFAQAVERCLQDASLRHCLGENGRKLVEDHYRWEQLGKRYHEYLTAIVRS